LKVTLLRKYREPQKGEKTRRLDNNLKNLNTEKLKTKPVIWKKLLGTEYK